MPAAIPCLRWRRRQAHEHERPGSHALFCSGRPIAPPRSNCARNWRWPAPSWTNFTGPAVARRPARVRSAQHLQPRSRFTGWRPRPDTVDRLQASFCAMNQMDPALFEKIRLHLRGPSHGAASPRSDRGHRFANGRRDRDPRPGEGGLRRGAGAGHDRTRPQPGFPEELPGGQTRPYEYRDWRGPDQRRQRRGRPRAQDLRRSAELPRPDPGRGRHRREDRPGIQESQRREG